MGDRRIGQTPVSPPAEPGAYLILSYASFCIVVQMGQRAFQ